MKSNKSLDLEAHKHMLNENLEYCLSFIDYFCIEYKNILKYLTYDNLIK